MHPQVESLRRRRIAAGLRPVRGLSVAEARAEDAAEVGGRATGAREPVTDVVDRFIPGPGGRIPVRLYRPQCASPPPVLVYFFGGGWVMGSLDTAGGICRRLANATPCAVVAVEYRRAPEHRFPAALEDCYAATGWVADHGMELDIDPSRLAVGGVSAGGNLAAAVTLLSRERRAPPFCFQLLVYPPLDHRSDTPSRREAVDPNFFDRDDLAWCWEHYLARASDGDSPLASPLREADLSGLPPALVITAEHDPVRDEGELYAHRLAEAGVPTELVRFEGIVHGFYSMNGELDAAERAQELTASALRRALLPAGPGRL
jgi:acetyl esterase